MKIKISLFGLILLSFLCPLCNYANSEYQEVYTSVGKVIVGLNTENALERFGIPASVSDNLWCYTTPERFFVYFTPASLLNIYLYPQFCEVSTDVPLEFKAFGYFSDLKIKDITPLVEFLISETQDFILLKPGVIIPKKTGEYQVLAKYRNIFSNPSHLLIKKSQEKDIEKEKLLSINVLPYKPIVNPGSKLQFVALGTFFDSSEGKYFIRDISQEATWFIKRDKDTSTVKNNIIRFPLSLGKFTVFCKYKGLESFPQEVEVKNIPQLFKPTLKHITLLPEFIFVSSGHNLNLKAFGTYRNNRVEERTDKAKWKISDKETLASVGGGEFLAQSEGISEVMAELDNLESLPAKIIVVGKKDSLPVSMAFALPETRKIYFQDLFRDIKNDTENMSKVVFEEEKKLKTIRIIPGHIKVSLGEDRQVAALGIYSDNSEEDLTLLGEWITSDDKVFVVSKGKISTRFTGEANLYVKFKGISSQAASVIVEGPKLVSIIISPMNSQISMRGGLNFKAEGYFTDSSRKDITSFVAWKITNPRVIKIEQGRARPLSAGQTQVIALYLQVKSLPANVKVIITIGWLIFLIIKIIAFLILGVMMLFTVLYFITEKKKNKLKISLQKNPREFIVNLYENVREILLIFGLRHEGVLAPLSYAELVDNKYSTGNNLFLKFTMKFEEAKYSRHIFQSPDAFLILNDYNNFLKILFSGYNKLNALFKYCLTLLQRRPLFISNP